MLKPSFFFFSLFLTLATITNSDAMQIWIFNDQYNRHEYLIPAEFNGFQTCFDLYAKWGVFAPHEQYSFKEYMSWKIGDKVYNVLLKRRRLAALKFSHKQDVVMVDEPSSLQISEDMFYERLQQLHTEVLNSFAINARSRLNFEAIVRANLARLTDSKKEILYKNFIELCGQMDISN